MKRSMSDHLTGNPVARGHWLSWLLLGWLMLTVGCRREPSSSTVSTVEPIRIGEFSSLTGPLAGLGQYTHMGVVLAAEQINAAGGVLGRPIEVIAEDTGSKAGTAAPLVRKLISRDHVVAIVGEGASGRCLEGAYVAQGAGVPVVSPAATDPQVTSVGDCIFRVCYTDPFQGTVVAKFIRQNLGLRRVGLLVDTGSSYSVGLVDFFRKRFLADGGDIAGEQRYTSGDKDFRGQLTALKATRPEAIFAPCYFGEAALILRQARELGIEVPLLGGDGWEAPELVEIAGAAADGAMFPVHFSVSSTAESSRRFVDQFTARFHKAPTGVSALGYDALQLLADAMHRAGSTASPAIRQALSTTRGWTGVTGEISLDEERNARKPATIVRVEKGQLTFVCTVTP